MIPHYLQHGGANPDWIRETAEMARDPEPSQHELEEGWAYDDEARAEAYQREERDRCERETGRPR